MTKGKPWDIEDEKTLREAYASGKRGADGLATLFGGKYSPNAVYQKLLDLNLAQKEEEAKGGRPSSSTLELPKELPTVEESLMMLAGALKALEQPGLDKTEVLRLRGVISGCKIYKEVFADYMNYVGLEQRLIELEAKYTQIEKKEKSS